MSFIKNFGPRFVCLLPFALAYSSVRAQAIDGFVSPAFSFVTQLNSPTSAVSPETNASATTDEGKARTRLDLQFGRIQRNVEFDLGLGNGGGYSDVGAILRVFNHFHLSEKSSTGISIGLGGGACYSTQGIWATLSTGSDSQRKFYELIVSPFARFIWDPMWGIS